MDLTTALPIQLSNILPMTVLTDNKQLWWRQSRRSWRVSDRPRILAGNPSN